MRYLLLFFVFPLFAYSQEITTIPLYIVNQDQESVAKNSRFEVAFRLSDSIMRKIDEYMRSQPHQRTGLNPFVSWDIDVQAQFIHSETGESDNSIGFWYNEIRRNTRENRWDEVTTLLPFRVRFAPTKTGEWALNVKVYVKQQLLFESEEFVFNVIPSNFKGFVKLNPETQYLERDGQTIIPTGVNLPFPHNFNNLIYNQDPKAKLDLKPWENFHWMLEDYISKGGEHFRTFLHPSTSDIEFEEVGYYQDRQNYAWEFDKVIETCEKNNVIMQFNILYHQIFMKMGDYYQFRFDYADYWHDENAWPYKDVNEISGYSRILNSKTPSDMFLDPLAIRYLKERTRYILARWGYSTCISMIELASEPWHVDEDGFTGETPYNEISEQGDIARKAAFNYHREISNYIKDTIQYKKHLLGAVGGFPMGSQRIFSNANEDKVSYSDSTWFLKNIDIISISFYSSSPEKLLITKSGKNNECAGNENSMACAIKRLNDVYGKPVIFGESDNGDGSYECSDYNGHKVDIMRYAYTGAIGHHLWAVWGYDEDENGNITSDERKAWPEIIQAKNYFNSPWFRNLINEREAFGREKAHFKKVKSDIIETQYILDKENYRVGGYIYNRTYNVSTADQLSKEELAGTPCESDDEDFSNRETIPWKPQRVKVEGLRPWIKYKITFYDYQNLRPFYEDSYSSNVAGKLKIAHPDLVPDVKGTPLLFYRIERFQK